MANLNAQLRPAWINYWGGFVLALVLLVAALVIYAGLGTDTGTGPTANAVAGILLLLALVSVCSVVFKRFSWQFSIEENRLSRHYGIISRNQQSVRINDLRSIELNQGLIQRLFGVGDLLFYSAGSAAAEVTFFGIKDPKVWRDRIHEAMDQLQASNE